MFFFGRDVFFPTFEVPAARTFQWWGEATNTLNEFARFPPKIPTCWQVGPNSQPFSHSQLLTKSMARFLVTKPIWNVRKKAANTANTRCFWHDRDTQGSLTKRKVLHQIWCGICSSSLNCHDLSTGDPWKKSKHIDIASTNSNNDNLAGPLASYQNVTSIYSICKDNDFSSMRLSNHMESMGIACVHICKDRQHVYIYIFILRKISIVCWWPTNWRLLWLVWGVVSLHAHRFRPET